MVESASGWPNAYRTWWLTLDGLRTELVLALKAASSVPGLQVAAAVRCRGTLSP